MKDERIIELFFERNEDGLHQVQEKYEEFRHTVASNILALREDREECVNDALLALWNSIPPEKPQNLKAYIAKIVRNLALKRTRSSNMWKRCANYMTVGEEFLETIPDERDLAEQFEASRAAGIINDFLDSIPEHERQVFVLRYYFGESIPSVAEDMGFSTGKVKSMLMRTRNRLAERLGKEGIIV